MKPRMGDQFGLLTVLADETVYLTRNGTQGKGIPVHCVCGRETIVQAASLVSGKTRSCGCIRYRHNEPSLSETFGFWTVIGTRVREGRYRIPCRCVCGTVRNVERSTLLDGSSTNCGCIGRKEKRLVQPGDVFGYWTVLRYAGKKLIGSRERPYYECECYCGSIRDVLKSTLIANRSFSCGCRAGTGELRQMHGLSRDGEIKSRLYKTWQGYQQHGLNGPTWDCNFAAFYDWAIGTNYEEGMTLARINKGQECSPANCFWLDAKSATLNQRRSA